MEVIGSRKQLAKGKSFQEPQAYSIFAMHMLIEKLMKSLIRISVIMFTILLSCNTNEPAFDCLQSTLQISLVQKKDITSCGSSSGEIEVQAINGFPPYSFAINGKAEQTSSLFKSLSAGSYSIVAFDSKRCSVRLLVEIKDFESTLNATAIATENSMCLNVNGALRVTPTGGSAPYSFRINNGLTTSDSIFNNLSHGTYSVFVRDAKNCTTTFSASVPRANTGVSWVVQIKPIVDVSCAKSGCHVAGTGRVDFTKFENVKSNAVQIKTRVGNKSMPVDATLPVDQIQLITCWVDDGALDN